MLDECVGIDKRSSAELSEAINSMWIWYRSAIRCVAYLSDVDSKGILDKWNEFYTSQWFKRGWTLQELLAPNTVTFCNSAWSTLGTLGGQHNTAPYSRMHAHVSHATGIELEILLGGVTGRQRLADACVAKRLAWAAERTTTRPEDMAYCLFGLLNVNMPLLYGEGGERAFIRLQQEIIKQSDDESIFAWRRKAMDREPFGLLAPTIRCFKDSKSVQAIVAVEIEHTHRNPYSVTNKGVIFEARASKLIQDPTRAVSGTANMDCLVPMVVLNWDGEDEGKLRDHHPAGDDSVGMHSADDWVTDYYLVRLNCRSNVDGSSDDATQSERCVIIIREGPGNIAHRVMAATLHPDVASSGWHNPESRSFIVRLTSGY